MERLAMEGGSPVRKDPWVSEFQGVEALGQAEKDRVLGVLEKRRIFRYLSDGYEESEAYRLEEEYREMTGCRYALAVNSGTSALVSALIGIGVGPGDEVLIPAFAWVATASAVLLVNAIPVLCEIDDSLTLDTTCLGEQITSATKALIVVHMRGISADMDKIMAFASQHQLAVIEDAAQSNGGTYRGRSLGSFGNAGCFSLQQYKIVTSGEGGVVVTNDEIVWQRAAMYHDCGRNPFDFVPQKIDSFAGQNYRITELQAALCLGQMDRMQAIIQAMRSHKQKIADGIRTISGLDQSAAFGTERDLGVSTVFYLPDALYAARFEKALRAEGIPCSVIYRPDQTNLHVYRYWDFLMTKRDAWGGHFPWQGSPYSGAMSYDPDMCPQTLNLLGRAIQVRLNQFVTQHDVNDLLEAIEKVAAHIL